MLERLVDDLGDAELTDTDRAEAAASSTDSTPCCGSASRREEELYTALTSSPDVTSPR